MARETARAKADRILIEGRIVVTDATSTSVEAVIRGEGAIHRAGWHLGKWECSCAARTDQCSHLNALRRVVAPDLTHRRAR